MKAGGLGWLEHIQIQRKGKLPLNPTVQPGRLWEMGPRIKLDPEWPWLGAQDPHWTTVQGVSMNTCQ